jgi:predicted RNA methylase
MINKFTKKIFTDEDGYYMSCPEEVGKHISNKLSKYKSAVDLCCAVGMLCVQLAKKINKVYGVDINPNRLSDARKNLDLYNVSNVEFIEGSVIDEELLKTIKADVAILDPDWSIEGNDKDQWTQNLNSTQPSWKKMFELTSKNITKNIVSRIPKNWGFELMNEFGPCKIENIIWDDKIKFRIVYFLEDINENIEENVFF